MIIYILYILILFQKIDHFSHILGCQNSPIYPRDWHKHGKLTV